VSLAWCLLAQPMLLTCNMISPGEKLEGLDEEEGNELSSREGEGGQNFVLQLERGGMRKMSWFWGPTYL